MGGAASADRTHYTPGELREEVGDDLGEELEAFIALAATDENVRATLARNAPGAAAAFSKASVDRWEVQLNRLVLARL